MSQTDVALCAVAAILLAPTLARATECRTASGQVFEAPAAAASAFTMAVRSCGATPAQAGATLASTPRAAVAKPAGLSPLLRLYEAPGASTDIRVRSSATTRVVRERLSPASPRGRRFQAPSRAIYPAPAYRLQTGMAVVGVARAYDIDPELLGSVVHLESGANPYARSPKGALGLMQVMPGTARRFGVSAPVVQTNPVANLAVGAAYLKSLQRLYGDNLPLILAAYNAGEGAVARHHRSVPPYRETTGYVGSVLGRYRNAIYARAYSGSWRVAAAR